MLIVVYYVKVGIYTAYYFITYNSTFITFFNATAHYILLAFGK